MTEKLNLTNYIEEVTFFRNSIENSEIQKKNNSILFDRKAITSIFLMLIVLPEILIYSGKIGYALILYVGLLANLSLISIFLKDPEIRKLCQALLLLPLLRLINFSIPVFSEIPFISFVFIYSPMIIPIVILVIHQKFTYNQLGLDFKNILLYLPISILIGFILGQVEYSTMQITPLIPDISLISILKLTILMVLFVGVVEEIIFRSILQTRLEEIYGIWSGLILSSIIYGLMNSGCGNLYEIIYTFFVGLLIGYMFQKIRSLPLIAMIHGFINVFSFGILPYLKPGIGLF